MLVETTNYYARDGQTELVLQQRRRATAVRVLLGLPPGRIYVKVEGAGPDVRWECAYESREEYDRDMAVRASSAEFAAARKEMHGLVERFERNLQQTVGD
jgi:hypothetical protein